MSAEDQVKSFRENLQALRAEIGTVIVGQEEVVTQVLLCLLAGGHAMLEGVPGLGKTLLVRTLSQCLNLKFSRIQFTPDLMPADIIGTHIVVEDEARRRSFQFHRGPVFGNVILADEINRATPKTQSALLEAMQEHAVTVAGTRYPLDEPFSVLATQNPIEMEGTYPLPEAQLDRFLLKLKVTYPSRDEERSILERMAGGDVPAVKPIVSIQKIAEVRRLVRDIYMDEKLKTYILDLTMATREPAQFKLPALKPLIAYGASPRATLALAATARALAFLNRRGYVTPEDVKTIGPDVLRHRILVSYEAEAENITSENIIQTLFEAIEVP